MEGIEFLCFDENSLNDYDPNTEVNHGVLDSSTYEEHGATASAFIRKSRDDEVIVGSVVVKNDGKRAMVYTNHQNHRRLRVVRRHGVEVFIQLPDCPADPDADQGFMRDEDWRPQDPIRIKQQGDFEGYVRKVYECMEYAKRGEDVDLVLPQLIRMKK